MSYELTLHQDSGDTQLPFEGAEIDEALGKMDVMRATTLAPAATAADIDERQDTATLREDGQPLFGGIVANESTDGGRAELIVDSWERLARDAQPSGPKYNFSDRSDSWIVEDAIDDVDGLQAGTVETILPNMEARFNHASPANRLRTIASETGGYVTYNYDKTVDYVTDAGTDHPDNEALRPDPRGALTDYRLSRKGTDNEITHLRALGSGKGATQLVAEVVIDSFDSTSDRAVWGVTTNTEIGSPSALQRWAERVLEERSRADTVEIETGVALNSSNLAIDALKPGDTVRVVIGDENVDRRVEVASVTRTISNEGDTFDAEFSDKPDRVIPDERTKIRADLERYNRAAADPRTERQLNSLGYVFTASRGGAN